MFRHYLSKNEISIKSVHKKDSAGVERADEGRGSR